MNVCTQLHMQVPIISVINLQDIVDRLRTDTNSEMIRHLPAMETYLRTYGIKHKL